MPKTTKEHYRIFVNECKRLAVLWHLTDWKFYFEHDENKGNRAQIWMDADNHVATIQLAKEWDNVTNNGIIETARHEMIHLIFGNLVHMAECRYCTSSEMALEKERLTRHLYYIIFGSEGCFETCPTTPDKTKNKGE